MIATYIGLAAILINIGIGISFNISVNFIYDCDEGFQSWKDHSNSCLYTYRVIATISSFQFLFFRFLYSKTFNREYFSSYFSNGEHLLTTSSRLSYAIIVFTILPMVFICGLIIFAKEEYDQTLYNAIDTLILSILLIIFVVIDGTKNGQ
jgi:hypothetical protein